MASFSNSERMLLEMASEWLRQYKGELGTNGCNDFWLPNKPEYVELLKNIEDWNGTDLCDRTVVSKSDKEIYVPDFLIVAYLSHALEEMSKKSDQAPIVGVTSVLDAEEGEG